MRSRQILKTFLLMMIATALAGAECDSASAVGERPPSGRILFDRGGGELWVIDGDGGHARHVLSGATWASLNPDGVHILYWNGQALHVRSLKDGCDAVVEDSLQSPLLDLGWSGDGKTLTYIGTSRYGSGLHIVPFPAYGVPKVFEHFNHVALSANGEYALSSMGGVWRVNVRTGERTKIADRPANNLSPWGAAYLGSEDIIAVLNEQPGNDKVNPDTPDCRGANTVLQLRKASLLIPVPFPKGFNSTLGYEFDLSPDGSQLAVSFAADRCDYPGDVAAVYLFSVSSHTLSRISPKDRLAGRVKFSPDGKALIYTDFQGTGTTAIYRYDLATRQLRPLTTPREGDYDYVIDWR